MSSDLNLKYLLVLLILTVFQRGLLFEKWHTMCSKIKYEYSNITNNNRGIRSYRIFGYIESRASYRNPFYIPFNESTNCIDIMIQPRDNYEIIYSMELNFRCGGLKYLDHPCISFSFERKNCVYLRFLPHTSDNKCKEWSIINYYRTDFRDYFIVFGCEDGAAGLWILMTTETSRAKQAELKINRIIENDFSEIKQDIVFVPDWEASTDCLCHGARPFQYLETKHKCHFERLDTCVLVQNDSEIFWRPVPIVILFTFAVFMGFMLFNWSSI